MAEETTEKPKYVGYGYHGGGRKKMSESGRKQIQISLQQEEVDLIKRLASEQSLPVSRFIIQCVNAWNKSN